MTAEMWFQVLLLSGLLAVLRAAARPMRDNRDATSWRYR